MNSALLIFPLLPVLLGSTALPDSKSDEAPVPGRIQDDLLKLDNELKELKRDLSLHPPPAAQPVVLSRIKLKAGEIVIPGDDLQQVEAGEGGIVKIRRECSWFSTLPATEALDAFVRPPAELKENAAFQKLVKEVARRAKGEDVLRTLSTAVVHLNLTVRQEPEELPGGEAAALEKGKAGPVVWNRLLVALCRGVSLPAREVHGLLITPGEPKAKASRRVWIEVLQEEEWLAFDPWFSPAPSDDGDYALEYLLEGGCDQYVPAPLMSLHITVVRGQPNAEQEKFLNSSPEVIECDATKGNAMDGLEMGDPDVPRLPPFKGEKNHPNRKY